MINFFDSFFNLVITYNSENFIEIKWKSVYILTSIQRNAYNNWLNLSQVYYISMIRLFTIFSVKRLLQVFLLFRWRL